MGLHGGEGQAIEGLWLIPSLYFVVWVRRDAIRELYKSALPAKCLLQGQEQDQVEIVAITQAGANVERNKGGSSEDGEERWDAWDGG